VAVIDTAWLEHEPIKCAPMTVTTIINEYQSCRDIYIYMYIYIYIYTCIKGGKEQGDAPLLIFFTTRSARTPPPIVLSNDSRVTNDIIDALVMTFSTAEKKKKKN